eukprot:CAMPEP_0183423556 /NCGR_PEP_ID=MMETSP0370-20130417/28569_1 /TAXON_ID=268820 /ORGANISM="Peridinium aciculiferum, Strain PAER-2" /LENGTH=67 /DNA_ID=CAMNT_0025607751 /DNA_START=76 /DNA_END=276 /DNA_ORIENTATION=+
MWRGFPRLTSTNYKDSGLKPDIAACWALGIISEARGAKVSSTGMGRLIMRSSDVTSSQPSPAGGATA